MMIDDRATKQKEKERERERLSAAFQSNTIDLCYETFSDPFE